MEEELILQNPWWKGKGAIEDDEKVRIALSREPGFNYDFDLENSILLGARQIGKTTFLKTAIHNLIKKDIDPKKLVYFSCEPLKDKNDLIELFRTIDQIVMDWAYIFLDEITSVIEWEKAIKYFLETGLCKNKIVVITGSNAAVLKHGTERLPGRNIDMRLFLPLSFKQFTDTFYRKFNHLDLKEINVENLHEVSLELMPYLDDLNKYLRIYLVCGGYLKPTYEFFENGGVSEETYEIYVRWVLGDLSKIGKKERLFRSVINGVIRMYSSSYSLSALAKEMEIPAHSTLSEYLDVLDDLMLTNNLYFFDVSKKTIILRKQRKTYFTDPFLYSVFRGYVHGKYDDYSTDAADKLIEGVVLEHLARADRHKNYDGFLGYYAAKKETDFVFCRDRKIGVEIKWQNMVGFQDFSNKHLFDENILLSKTTFKRNGDSLIIPVSIFLMAVEREIRG